MCVRSPASCSRSSRSAPIAPPRMPATKRRARRSSQLSSGSTDRLHGLPLGESDLLDPARSQVEQVVQLVAGERSPLGRDQLDDLLDLATGGIEEIGLAQRKAVEAVRAT